MIFDVVVVGLLLVGFYKGYRGGFIRTILNIIGVVVAVLFSFKGSRALQPVIEKQFGALPQDLMPIVAFISAMIFVLLAFKLVSWMFESVLKSLKINFINKAIGGVLGTVSAAFFISLTISFSERFGFQEQAFFTDSFLYDALQPVAPFVSKYLQLFFEQIRRL